MRSVAEVAWCHGLPGWMVAGSGLVVAEFADLGQGEARGEGGARELHQVAFLSHVAGQGEVAAERVAGKSELEAYVPPVASSSEKNSASSAAAATVRRTRMRRASRAVIS
ncbi:hypothetical protein [Streptomyces sp. NPDC003015]